MNHSSVNQTQLHSANGTEQFTMAGRFNIYSQLVISAFRIVDISN